MTVPCAERPISFTAAATFARLFPLPVGVFSAFGFLAMMAAAANTPIAAAVMGIELLPGQVGVCAALAAGAAFLLVGHRSVYCARPRSSASGQTSWTGAGCPR